MNAAMEKRTNIEWDKDDIDALHMLKVDVLALGMLTCIRKGFEFIGAPLWAARFRSPTVPAEDPAVYDMLSKADSIGVFQVESRAQMSMLPRLKPRDFYDLVIEVAIVRPGRSRATWFTLSPSARQAPSRLPIRLRNWRPVLKRTLGRSPLPGTGDANRHRRSRFLTRRGRQIAPGDGDVPPYRNDPHLREKFIAGMIKNGYGRDFAERCFNQIEGFGEYGFPRAMRPASRCWSISPPETFDLIEAALGEVAAISRS